MGASKSILVLVNPWFQLLYLRNILLHWQLVYLSLAVWACMGFSTHSSILAIEASLFVSGMLALLPPPLIIDDKSLGQHSQPKTVDTHSFLHGDSSKESPVFTLNAESYRPSSGNPNNGWNWFLFVLLVLLIFFHISEPAFWSQFWVHKNYATLKCVRWHGHV